MLRTRLYLAWFLLYSSLAQCAAQDQAVLLNERPSKSIAIVGAGSAGLAVLKTLLDLPPEVRRGWEIELFEERRSVGGVWLPDPNDPHPPEVPETPLYPDLKTNTPHPLMTYPHFPFRPLTPIFPHHEYVEQYHVDFARHFKLYRHIRLNTTVERASWIGGSVSGRWNVTVNNRYTGERRHASFDHLIAANGHNRYPYIPTWPGQEDWLSNASEGGTKREILHSVFWRNASKYEGQTVLVVGGGASGRDVALHVAPVAKKVYLSLKEDKFPRRLPVDYDLKPEISHFLADSIVFTDGTSSSDVDSIVLGTGYELRIPFLTEGGALKVDPSAHSCPLDPSNLTTNLRYLFPLHEHIFSLAGAYPSNALAFVGLPMLVANCPSDIAQSLLVAHGIANISVLPPRDEMLSQLREKEDILRAHDLDPYQVGHRLVDIAEQNGPEDRAPDMAHDYQDAIVKYLKEHGALPNDGKPFVEEWRRSSRNNSELLWNAWERVESQGDDAVKKWLEGAETEGDWVKVIEQLVEWERRHEA